MIVTLAGHVDHGKTSLVRALSGVDTDRLQEEKDRGLTIDLGFAYIDDGAIGFVDVPGHQRFIHNMVAGVAADQTALLVIAADDGPMPQSREHLDIMSMLGITRGVIALTKCDRVNDARLAACENEIRALVADTFLEGAAIFHTRIDQPESVAPLLDWLRSSSQEIREHEALPFRLAIDRRFSVKGAGLVVTGTVHGGSVHVDDEIHHFPSGRSLRVRGLRAQDRDVTSSSQGDRCAINIAGIDLQDVERGHWLTERPASAARCVTVTLRVSSHFPRHTKHWTPIHVYHATSHATGRLAMLDARALAPGDQALVDLVLDEPLAVLHGDALVIRDQGLDATLGGGTVAFVSPHDAPRRRQQERLARLTCYLERGPQACARALLSQEGHFEYEPFQNVWALDDTAFDSILTDLKALRLGRFVITRQRIGELAKLALEELSAHLDANADATGFKENEFKTLPRDFAAQVLGALVQTNKLALSNGEYTLVGREAALPDQLAARLAQIKPHLDADQPASTGDMAKLFSISIRDLEQELRELSRRRALVYVADHRYFLPERLTELAAKAAAMAERAPFSVREFRDATGMGRNVAIEVLEYFDSKGFTRREDNVRRVLRPTL